MPGLKLRLLTALCLLVGEVAVFGEDARPVKITVTFDRGEDLGQSFGSLFEATSEDGSLVIGAGFQNLYNTFYRADRHEIQFFVRPASGDRAFETQTLPRPHEICGTYLTSRDGIIRTAHGEAKTWDAAANAWRGIPDSDNSLASMRLGDGLLEFGESTAKYNGTTIVSPPEQGDYQHFFYAHGHLCFYHVHRGDRGYRPYENDADGFSKLYACPWKPGQSIADLSRAVVLTLPVVGETTFAWGQFASQVLTGSNIGGFYVFDEGRWSMLLKPNIDVSYQLYSTMAFHDRLLMGQYPTGRLFEYDGKAITDVAGWPPKLEGVSGSSREAQTTVIYGGDLFVGVWPWGELWRYNPTEKNSTEKNSTEKNSTEKNSTEKNSTEKKWTFARRMFDHPELSDSITHPYDVENKENPVSNLWGQRVTSLVTNGSSLFISTSAKSACEWDPIQNPFLAPDKWKSYGAVYQMTMPGHLGATTGWTSGPTTLEFTISGSAMTIAQDGKPLTRTTLTGPLADQLRKPVGFKAVGWGDGIYGKFTGPMLHGHVEP